MLLVHMTVTVTLIIFEIYWAGKHHKTEVDVGVQVMGSIDSRVSPHRSAVESNRSRSDLRLIYRDLVLYQGKTIKDMYQYYRYELQVRTLYSTCKYKQVEKKRR